MMTKEKMVDVLRATGLDERQMQQLHRVFEQRYPAEHQAFLTWLGLDAAAAETIRREARS